MADAGKGCVLFVDLQEGLVETARTLAPAGLRRGARVLADVARALDMPCFASVVPVGPSAPPPLIAELREVLDGAHVGARSSFGAAGHPGLAAARGADATGPLLVAGILTEGAVLRTVLDARRAGWAVQVVLDASAGLSARTEDAAIRRIEAAGATTTSIVSLAATAPLDLGDARGRTVMGLLRSLLGGAAAPA